MVVTPGVILAWDKKNQKTLVVKEIEDEEQLYDAYEKLLEKYDGRDDVNVDLWMGMSEKRFLEMFPWYGRQKEEDGALRPHTL